MSAIYQNVIKSYEAIKSMVKILPEIKQYDVSKNITMHLVDIAEGIFDKGQSAFDLMMLHGNITSGETTDLKLKNIEQYVEVIKYITDTWKEIEAERQKEPTK